MDYRAVCSLALNLLLAGSTPGRLGNIMLLRANQILLDSRDCDAITYEVHHNRVEATLTRWDGENFLTLATVNSFVHDSLGEVLCGLLVDGGYDGEKAVMIIDDLGMWPSEEEE